MARGEKFSTMVVMTYKELPKFPRLFPGVDFSINEALTGVAVNLGATANREAKEYLSDIGGEPKKAVLIFDQYARARLVVVYGTRKDDKGEKQNYLEARKLLKDDGGVAWIEVNRPELLPQDSHGCDVIDLSVCLAKREAPQPGWVGISFDLGQIKVMTLKAQAA